MVEDGARPTACVVTRGARGRECRGHVVRVRHTGVISLMAGVTIRGRACVFAADVTVRTLHGHVRSRQREGSLAMVEVRGRPSGGAVADFTGLRESGGNVIGIRSAVEVREMTRVAESTQTCVFAAGVASRAGLANVSSCQREERLGVIENCPRPAVRRVANGAVSRKSSGRMVWIRGLLEVSRVATGAIFWRTSEASVYVAL